VSGLFFVAKFCKKTEKIVIFMDFVSPFSNKEIQLVKFSPRHVRGCVTCRSTFVKMLELISETIAI
jgi:hypothetical protein